MKKRPVLKPDIERWDTDSVQRWMRAQHNKIYTDLDGIRFQIKSRPHYKKFLSEEEAALIICILLKDSNGLSSKDALVQKLKELTPMADEQFNSHRSKEELNRSDFKRGWKRKLKEITELFVR